MIAWSSARGAKRAFDLPEIGIKNQIFLENLNSASYLRLIDLILAMTVFFSGMKLTLHKSQVHRLVSCSDDLAVHLYPLLCLQRWVAKVANGLFYCWSLLGNNNMATNLEKFTSRRFVA